MQWAYRGKRGHHSFEYKDGAVVATIEYTEKKHSVGKNLVQLLLYICNCCFNYAWCILKNYSLHRQIQKKKTYLYNTSEVLI